MLHIEDLDNNNGGKYSAYNQEPEPGESSYSAKDRSELDKARNKVNEQSKRKGSKDYPQPKKPVRQNREVTTTFVLSGDLRLDTLNYVIHFGKAGAHYEVILTTHLLYLS